MGIYYESHTAPGMLFLHEHAKSKCYFKIDTKYIINKNTGETVTFIFPLILKVKAAEPKEQKQKFMCEHNGVFSQKVQQIPCCHIRSLQRREQITVHCSWLM